MAGHDVAFVGTGADPDDPDMSGFAMAYHHAEAYERLDDCEIVACADVVPENAAAFAETFDVPEDQTFTDHEEMLAEARPDVVSVCVPPSVHADIVVDCAHSGAVDAVHCEKPMALTWGGARQMAAACWRRGVQLTFNHQRRFKPSWVRAREVIDAGAIGDLERVETAPPNLYDWGTHCIDFMGDVVGDRPAEWVIGNVDYREEQVLFGAHNENQALGLWEYDNGVTGMIATGAGASTVPAFFRFQGTEGELHLDPEDDADLRWRAAGDEEWTTETVDAADFAGDIEAAIEHVVACLDAGEEPVLSAKNALNATEIIFGVWESARRRGRVDTPLEIDDNPLEEMVASGALQPEPSD
jgi:predicted dehydrogenase